MTLGDTSLRAKGVAIPQTPRDYFTYVRNDAFFYTFTGLIIKHFKIKNMKRLLLLGIIATALYSCNETPKTEEVQDEQAVNQYEGLQEKAKGFFGELPLVAENEANPITAEKVELGKMLYYENRLSKDNTQSCNTCHDLDTYGVDNKPTSEGNNGGLGTRNSPTTLNAALHMTQFWDGREPDVEAQAGGPVLNPVEMEMPSEEAVVERLSAIEEYQEWFAKAFPEDETPITYDNMKKAIGAFERKLITPSKFDDFLAGNEEALTNEEKEGLETYIETGCTTCHAGNALGGNMYQKFGLFGNYWDLTKSKVVDNGRFDLTQNEADKYIFKVPSLRNIEHTYPYFHDGSVADLGESVKIMAKAELNKDLSAEDVDKIVTFLKTLNGEVPAELKQ